MRRRLAALASLVALVEGAAASSGHYDSGHLAVMAVVGGAVALGSSALGRSVGEVEKKTHDGESGAAPTGGGAPDGGGVGKIARAVADVAVNVAGDSTPQGDLVRSAYSVAKGSLTDANALAGAADGVASVATERLKAAVREGVSQGVSAPEPAVTPAAAVGTTARFCAGCGTPTRQGARFCASCGRKLV